ncbi:MAG: replicative DNA helicase [Clostridiales Family XIII bacterium]|jgi:replicative DNA helicase|nr:replicative DNA helicase [Clostridiales Family XIII bacterium]
MAERIPPHSDAAERSVLGAALQSKQALYDMMETLDGSDFFVKAHALIFDAMYRLHKTGAAVDIITVSEDLDRNKQLSAAGGRAYLGELTSAVPSPLNAMQYGVIIKEKSKLRRLIEQSGDIITMSYDSTEPANDILSKAENKILEIAQSSQAHEIVSVGDAIRQSLEKIREHYESGRKLLGITTGFGRLNKITSGFQKQDLIILAARPSMGKTALALNFALNAAMREDATIMIFSLEMGEQALAQRILSILSEVPLSNIRDGSFSNSKDDTEKINKALERLGKLNIEIDAATGSSINEMKNKCRRLKQKLGLDLVIVDYLQLMSLSGSERLDNRTLEIAAITRMLKLMAKELDCPVIVLSQTSRDYEKRSGRPMLSDLRDSGAIEQDADLIMFIHNKSSKEQDDDDDEFHYDPDINRMLLILKHRNGETGDVILRWIGAYTKFVDVEFRMAASPYEVSGDSRGSAAGDEDGYTNGGGGADIPEENYAPKPKLPF